jgi:hypothetical protein
MDIHIVYLIDEQHKVTDIVALSKYQKALELERKLSAQFGRQYVYRTELRVDQMPEFFGLNPIINDETSDWTQYRQLEEGEIVQPGDQVDICRDGWRDEPRWIPTDHVGQPAPDPRYPSHRRYRRLISVQG